MKVTALPAGDGDCLLVESRDGRVMLVDGGRVHAYEEHVRDALVRMRRAGTPLDLVCVSHIDDDHISGVVRLMDDLVDWAVHDFQVASGNDRHRPPSFGRPPEVRAVWHNGFSDQLAENSGNVERMLSQAAAVLAGAEDAKWKRQSHRNAAIVQGVDNAVALTRRLSTKQLGIPLNPEFGGKMVLGGRAKGKLALGSIAVSVLAPTATELDRLRETWNDWLRENEKALQRARARARQDERDLGNDVTRLIRPLELQAEVFGSRDEVTAPNLASIVLLLEENGRTALLTGDSHKDDIVNGLERARRLDRRGRCHVDLLKVPHHGSEHNADLEFFQHVTADHYLLCADGAHDNPDVGLVDLLLQARLGPSPAGPRRKFTLWCTYSSAVTDGTKQAHLRKVEQVVDKWRAAHPGAFKVKFRGLPGAPKGKLTISL